MDQETNKADEPEIAVDAQAIEAQKNTEEPQAEKLDYSDFMPQLRPKPKWPRAMGWMLMVLIVLAAIGVGAWQWDEHKNSPVASSYKTQHQTSTSRAAASSTKTYTSNNFNLTLAYPANWSLNDNGKLTIVSPTMEFKAADGQSQNGQVVVTIESQSSADMRMFSKGNAVAVLASQKVAYDKPASTQRADTYISFLQYAATTTRGALDGIYVTGDDGYEYGQIVPESDIVKIDPLIRVTFAACQDAKCTTTKPLSIAATEWNAASLSSPISSMIKSLQLN